MEPIVNRDPGDENCDIEEPDLFLGGNVRESNRQEESLDAHEDVDEG